MLTISYIALDSISAMALFRMSRRRRFPAPLCFLHGGVAIFHVSTFANSGDVYWEKFLLNRAFDMELAYISACALYRIVARNRAGLKDCA